MHITWSYTDEGAPDPFLIKTPVPVVVTGLMEKSVIRWKKFSIGTPCRSKESFWAGEKGIFSTTEVFCNSFIFWLVYLPSPSTYWYVPVLYMNVLTVINERKSLKDSTTSILCGLYTLYWWIDFGPRPNN